MRNTLARLALVAAVVALVSAGCAAATATRGISETPAAGLRTALNALLYEHVFLAAAATGHALGGRDAEFKAAAAALDANSVDLAKAIGSVYGADAEKAFLPRWRRHIGFFVDYTVGIGTGDRPKQDRAADNLVQYGEHLGAFLYSANPNLPVAAVADLVTTHVRTLMAVIDAQGARNPELAYSALRASAAHMQKIADPVAEAIVKQFPDKFAGSPGSPAAGLRLVLNLAFREHVFLAGATAGHALGGQEAEFRAAGAARNANSADLAKAIGSVYGADAEKAFLPLWQRHIGFFGEYIAGLRTQDKARQDKAADNLARYGEHFGAFLNSANPNLPVAVVAELVTTHILTLLDVFNAQAARNPEKTYGALRRAAAHMQALADPVAEAIVKQFPDRFAGR